MNIDFDELRNEVIGCTIPKPSGSLSGHATGGLFDNHVYNILKAKKPDFTFRQCDYLNGLYSRHPEATKYADRVSLIDSLTVRFLLSRKEKPTKQWSLTNLFEEKQDDTADILLVKDDFYNLLDIKAQNKTKKTSSRPPNIISGYKLAQMCEKMILEKEYDNFTIDYFEVDWVLKNDFLKCTDAHHACLFKVNPTELYINWTAGTQIQIHVCKVDQSFTGTKEEWAIAYLKHFVSKATKRTKDMTKKYVDAFKRHID